MTFKQKIAAYAERLAELPLLPANRRAYAAAYSGHGPIPKHCSECGRRSDERHADECRAPEATVAHRLCSECMADLTDGERHSDWCSWSDVFAGGSRG